MSRLEDLTEKFYERYSRPVIEPYILGFSGIDPPLKTSGAGSPTDHERLYGLLGGNSAGHYHLTWDEYDQVMELLDDYPPQIGGGQTITIIAGEEMPPYEIGGENLK